MAPARCSIRRGDLREAVPHDRHGIHVALPALAGRGKRGRRGERREAAVGGDVEGRHALGHVVVPEADLIGDLVELEMHAPEVLARHVPVVVLGLER